MTPPLDTGTDPRPATDENRRCAECGWLTRVDREYHPYVACLIVKATGNDPLMVMRHIAAEVATLNDKGQFPVTRDD